MRGARMFERAWVGGDLMVGTARAGLFERRLVGGQHHSMGTGGESSQALCCLSSFLARTTPHGRTALGGFLCEWCL